ncbi:MAG: ABC transporter permease [Deltaproteobacteria bacterium]|nr:ABC transporter permease [Deltaproteobacteria bacterium]
MIWAILIISSINLILAPLIGRWLKRHQGSIGIAVRLFGLLLFLALILWVIFHQFDLSIERNATLLWAFAFISAATVGFLGSRYLQKMPNRELFVALLLLIEVMFIAALFSANTNGLASPHFRALLVTPAILPLSSYFGASIGHLTNGSSIKNFFGYESFIARRFLLSRASQVLSTVTSISVIGVAIGVWLVIVSLSVLSGFENDLKQKIIGATAHIVVQSKDGSPFKSDTDDPLNIMKTPGVIAVSPIIEGEAAVSSRSNYTGAIVFGINPQRARKVLGVMNEVAEGSVTPVQNELLAPTVKTDTIDTEFPPPKPLPNIIIGVEMAKGLNVSVGDRINLISPLLETITPIGPAPKNATFKIAAIFSSKMYEYDARYVFISLNAARHFFELASAELTAIQAAVDDPESSDVIVKTISQNLPTRFEALDWKGRNQTLFSSLKLERVVAFVVLVFIILVASFAIVNTLTMSIVEKKKEIAILKTMGASDNGIMKLFLIQGLIIGAFGTLLGAIAAMISIFLLQQFGFAIPGDVYYIDSLPVHFDAIDVVVVILAALLIVWDFAVFPALHGANLSPVEGLRDV